jgi:hypothetical protein
MRSCTWFLAGSILFAEVAHYSNAGHVHYVHVVPCVDVAHRSALHHPHGHQEAGSPPAWYVLPRSAPAVSGVAPGRQDWPRY